MVKWLSKSYIFDRNQDSISICIAAYNAEKFIGETIESALSQTYSNLKILVSVDRSNDGTISALAPYAGQPRIMIFEQKKRQGWVANTNFLLRRVRTPYFMILPHDDILQEHYTEVMMDRLRSTKGAVAAFSDINNMGSHYGITVQPSLLGSLEDRIRSYLLYHYNAVIYRALVHGDGLKQKPQLSGNRFHDFSEDTVFGFKLGLEGELIRYPEAIYHKRYHDESYHAKWQQWPEAQMVEAWKMHCLGLLQIIKDRNFEPTMFKKFRLWSYMRYIQSESNLWHRDLLAPLLRREDHIEDFDTRMNALLRS